MTEVNVAELRRALATPSGVGHLSRSKMDEPLVMVPCSTLAALLDAYEHQERENTSLLAYGTHKPGCGGLTSTTGRACECGWIQVRDLAREASDGG